MAARSASILLVALLALFSARPAEAFLWPWQHHRYRHHSHRSHETAPPNCKQINDAVKDLDAGTLARALNSLTRKQRESVDQCATDNGEVR